MNRLGTQEVGQASAHPAIRAVTLCDADEQSRSLNGWKQEYCQLSCGKYEGEVASLLLPGVELIIESSNQQLHQRGNVPENTIALAVPLAMRGDGWVNGKKVDNDTCLVLSREWGLDFRTPHYLTVAAIVIDVGILAQYAHAFNAEPVLRMAITNRFAALPAGLSNTLRDYIRSLVNNVRCGDINLSHAASQIALRGALVSNFIHALNSLNAAPQMIPRSAIRRKVTVMNAVEYMRSNMDQSIGMADVCRELHVEQRVLLYCFREVLGVPPVAYLKCLRLHAVRRELKSACVARLEIGDVASRWGFWHLSRFSSDYRKLFDELPSETIRKTRR